MPDLRFPYTFENHFKFGYEPSALYRTRTNPNQKFFAQYGKIYDPPRSWRAANRLAARKIRESTQENLHVLYSGGIDSEVCLLSFLEEEIPVQVAILELENGLNAHDIEFAFRFCDKNGIAPTVYKLNIEEFWRSPEFYKLIDPIHCLSPIIACQLWLADQVFGVPILGQGEVHLKKYVDSTYVPGESPYLPGPWHLIESERLCAMYLHFMNRQKPAVPGFFQYMPDQIYAQLKNNPVIQSLVQNKEIGKLGTRTSKSRIVASEYPELELRPKLTGFEQIEVEHDILRAELAERFPASDQDFKMEYQQLLKDLSS